MTATARELMQAAIVRVGPDDTLRNVQRLFADEQIHGAPVVDDFGRVLGVISTSDLLRAAADDLDARRPSPSYFRDGISEAESLADESILEALGEQCVADVMTNDIVSVGPLTGIHEVAKMLRHNRVHRVLVMEDDVLVGVISSFDLIELLEKDA